MTRMDQEKIYRQLYLIRRTEEEIIRIYPTDKIKSPVHLSIGQEAISVGVCAALEADDIVFGTYRSHALYLAKTGDLKGFFAELYGKITGCVKGKGGSMHLANVSKGMMGTSAVVGTTIPQAVGYAYMIKQCGEKKIVVSFMGDGATEEGVFHESMNFAALKQLPIIFICENNSLAIHTYQHQRQHVPEVTGVVRAYGIPATRIEHSSISEIYSRVGKAVTAIRTGKSGPAFFECMTSRWKEHVGPNDDFVLGYRSQEEVQKWKDRDELVVLGKKIRERRRAQIETEVEKEIQEAIQFAEGSAFPGAEELYTDVFKERETSLSKRAAPMTGREIGFVDAVREALDQEMERDKSVIVFGLDVDDPKAIQGSTRGLPQKYGPDRAFGTPLSEDAMTGVAIGMALAGSRPVHVHIRMDFLMLAMNQLINMAAKGRYMFGGQISIPLVVRTMIGRSWGQGAQHSQALHSFFMHVPGLKVVAPSNPYDAKGCLMAAIHDDNPVIYIEHRFLHYQKGPVPLEPYEVLPGNARVAASGKDVTLVGISHMQLECMRARSYLETVGIGAEVIDPVWLNPLDVETIYTSVKKTRNLVIVDNGWITCGAAAEIAAQVAQHFEGNGDIRIRRMGFAPVTCPTTPSLEAHFYPNPRSIAAAVHKLVAGDKAAWYPEERREFQTFEFKGPF